MGGRGAASPGGSGVAAVRRPSPALQCDQLSTTAWAGLSTPSWNKRNGPGIW
jgi:hypothetical protein